MNNTRKNQTPEYNSYKNEEFPNKFDKLSSDELTEELCKDSGLIDKQSQVTGSTLLYRYVQISNYENAELLLEKGADPNLQNCFGETPLHQAIENKNYRIINLLLEKKANPNIQQQDGETPLHTACAKGDYKTVKLLLHYDLNPFVKTFADNLTAYDYAVETRNNKCAEILSPYMESLKVKNEHSNCYTNKKTFMKYVNPSSSATKASKLMTSPVNKLKEHYDFVTPCNISTIPNNTSKHSRVSSYSRIKGFTNECEFSEKRLLSRHNSGYSINQLSFLTKNAEGQQSNRNANFHYTDKKEDDLDRESQLSCANTRVFEDKFEKLKKEILQMSTLHDARTQFKSNINIKDNSINSSANKSRISSYNNTIIKENDNNMRECSCSPTPSPMLNKKDTENIERNRRQDGRAMSSIDENFKILGKITSLKSNNQENKFFFKQNENSRIDSTKHDNNLRKNYDHFQSNHQFAKIKSAHRKYYSNNNLNHIAVRLSNEPSSVHFVNLNDYSNINSQRNNLSIVGRDTFNEIGNSSRFFAGDAKFCRQNSDEQLTSIKSLNSNRLREFLHTTTEHKIAEQFIDRNNVLARFTSERNDILIDDLNSTQIVNERRSDFDLDNENISINGFDTKAEHYGENVQIDQRGNNELSNVSEIIEENNQTSVKVVEEFSMTKKIKFVSNAHFINRQGQKQIVFDSDSFMDSTINEHSLKDEDKSESEDEDKSNTSPIEEEDDGEIVDYSEVGIYNFLKNLEMENLFNVFVKNGFDDYPMMVDQMKSNSPITHENLKKIGVNLPGQRAKILMKLEEEAKNFHFDLPQSLFHNIDSKLLITKNYDLDPHITIVKNWLKNLKLENYITNFICAGYYSLELLILQMASRNPLNDKILEEELKIDKIGHRLRILNKLNTEAKLLVEKLSKKVCTKVIQHKDPVSEACKCIIF